MNGLRILREVTSLPDFALSSINDDRHLIQFDDKTLWVDVEQPWDAGIANEITRGGGGYIVTDAEGGRIAGPYRALDKAEAVRKSAKVQVVSVVDEDDEDPVFQAITDVIGGNADSAPATA